MSATENPTATYVAAALVGGVLLFGGVIVLGIVPSPFHSADPVVATRSVDPAPPLVLHFGDAQGMYLVPVQVAPETPTTPGGWANGIFDRLRTAPRAGLVAAVAPDHKLIDATFAGERWNLTVEVGEPPGSTTERMLVGALVRTFVAGWPGAKEVQLKLVDGKGKPLASQHLDLSVPLTAADVANTAAAGDAPGGAAVKTTVWWPMKDGGTLVPVQLELKGATGIPPRDAFERLTQGPPAEAGSFLATAVPPGAKPAWSTLEAEGVAAIELGGELPGDARGTRFIEAVVLTLTEFTDVKAVRFTQSGKPIARTVGPFRLNAPVARPAAPNGAATAAGGKP